MKTLLESPNSGWKKLLLMYYGVEVSEEFINCADVQLTKAFEDETGIKVEGLLRLSWDQDNEFVYKKNEVSKINSRIALKYGFNDVDICWKSISGRIYDINDQDIDCSDIKFWFEGLAPKLCMHYWKPTWSLITFTNTYKVNLHKNSGIYMSEEFVTCMDKQLSALFTLRTGIKINKEISLMWVDENVFKYRKDTISIFTAQLYVHHNWDRITIAWKSKSGRIYDVSDEDIACDDIEFWFEDLDVSLIHSQVYAKGTLPFKLKHLSYELRVGNFSINCQFDLVLKKDHVGLAEVYMKNIDDFINSYNEKSEIQDRKNGVVHNWTRVLDSKSLIYELDLGSTGADFMKNLLKHLSDMNCFEKVSLN